MKDSLTLPDQFYDPVGDVYACMVLFKQDLYRCMKDQHGLTPLLTDCLIAVYALQGNDTYTAAKDVRKYLRRRDRDKLTAGLTELVRRGYIDLVKNNGFGRSARYAVNGYTKIIIDDYNREMSERMTALRAYRRAGQDKD